MLLLMFRAGGNRYAIDSRHVSEVLPQVTLHHLAGAPDWLAGVLIYRGTSLRVVDLVRLIEGPSCPNRLSSRILVLRVELAGAVRQFGLLAEQVGLYETCADGTQSDESDAKPTVWGTLHFDSQGVFQRMDIAGLLSEERQLALFGTVGEET